VTDNGPSRSNAINGTNVYVIYAQTDIFSVTGNCSEPAPVNTCPPATATVTVTRDAVRPSATHLPLTCIGWQSSYDHPIGPVVTAAPVPTALASTQVVYHTVYKDLSEGCGACPAN
jgi:hypothetical protein